MFAQHVTIEVLNSNYFVATIILLSMTLAEDNNCCKYQPHPTEYHTFVKEIEKNRKDLTIFLRGNLPQRAIGSCKVLVGVLGFTV